MHISLFSIYQLRFTTKIVSIFRIGQNKNGRQAEWECNSIVWQQVALMEQQNWAVSTVTTVNKAILLCITLREDEKKMPLKDETRWHSEDSLFPLGIHRIHSFIRSFI